MCEDDDLQQLQSYPIPSDGPIWCVAANVLINRPTGPGGAEIRHGTKHFAPGAKVYAINYHWDRVEVVGRHRKSKRFCTMILDPKYLSNWRAELVYSPHVIDQVQRSSEFFGYLHRRDEFRQRVEEIVARYRSRGATTQPYTTRQASKENDDVME
jgi:hypothetical protein